MGPNACCSPPGDAHAIWISFPCCDLRHRCRTGQVVGNPKEFCPNFPQLVWKNFLHHTIHEVPKWKPKRYIKTKKKIGLQFSGRQFLRKKSQILTYFIQSHLKVLKHLCPNFLGFFPEYLRILPRFSTNQEFWGCACFRAPPAAPPLIFDIGVLFG